MDVPFETGKSKANTIQQLIDKTDQEIDETYMNYMD